MSDTRTVRLADIKIGNRYRKDIGDLASLAASIAKKLLHPPVVDTEMNLVCGFRRLRAAELNGWSTIPVRVIDIEDLIEMEHDENELRKDFTISERVAIGAAIEAKSGERRGNPSIRRNSDELEKGKRTDEVAAEKAGFGSKDSYRDAKAVVDKGTPELVAAVDAGTVSVNAAAEVAKLPKSEQKKVVAKGPDAVKKAAKASRQAKAKTKPEPVSQPEPADKDSGTGVQTEPAAEPADELDTLLNRIKQLIKTSPELAEPAADELQTLAGYAAELAPAPPIDKRIVTLCRKLDGIAADMDAWKDDPLSYTISFITVQGGIKNVRTALWASRPCCQCPYCTGTGKHPRHGERCKGCKGTGLVTKTTEKSGKAAMGAA